MKTNFISNLKQLLFLFLAIIGTISGYAQSNQNSSNVDIGGGKSSDTGLGGYISGGSGSQGAPRGTGSGQESLAFLPFNGTTNCIFFFPTEIGGNTSPGHGDKGDNGQFLDSDFDPYDIGGKDRPTPIPFASNCSFDSYSDYVKEIGGGGRGTTTSTGQFDDDIDPYGIGGKSSTGGLGNLVLACDIGGSKTPDLGQGCDIGGRGSLGTGALKSIFDFECSDLEYFPGFGCNVETGGRGSRGTSTTRDYDNDNDDDTGGRNSSGTTGEFFCNYLPDLLI